MGRHETELVNWLRNHAAGLSYLGTNSVLKQQMHEAATAIEGLEVKVERDADGKWVIGRMSPQGWLWRHLTRRERLALWLLRRRDGDSTVSAKTPYARGYDAGLTGKSLTDCPYPYRTEARLDWRSGWRAGWLARKHLQG